MNYRNRAICSVWSPKPITFSQWQDYQAEWEELEFSEYSSEKRELRKRELNVLLKSYKGGVHASPITTA